MARTEIVHENFLRRVAAGDFPAGRPPVGSMSAEQAVSVFRAACLSRALDRQSRMMQRAGQGYYTIGSSDHESMAAVALALVLSGWRGLASKADLQPRQSASPFLVSLGLPDQRNSVI